VSESEFGKNKAVAHDSYEVRKMLAILGSVLDGAKFEWNGYTHVLNWRDR